MIYLNKKVMKKFDKGQEANVENQPGVDNRSFARRRVRNHAPQRRTQRMNPRTPQVLPPLDETAETPVLDDSIQQRMQGLYATKTTVCGSSCPSRQPVRATSTSSSSRWI